MDVNKQSTLWSILTKYDGVAEFDKFCDAISNFIQGKSDNNDIISIYRKFTLIDKQDYININLVIGKEITNYLFQYNEEKH